LAFGPNFSNNVSTTDFGAGRVRAAPVMVADDPFNNVSWNCPRHVRNCGLRHLQAVDDFVGRGH
jgi:hypothetical protein